MKITTDTKYRICIKTVMDTSDPDIKFDENGISNYWWEYHRRAETELKHGEEGLAFAKKLANEIKQENHNRPYDCLIGVSGGVDSSYAAYWTHKLGLRAMAVHLDNGWNNQLAIANIEALVKHFDLDLHTEVLDWPEFRDLQRSFFLASVPNCETPTDHAIIATLFRLAANHGIRYIISGANLVTEGINQKNAGHDNKDYSHIEDIQHKFGQHKLKYYPHLGTLNFIKSILVDRVRFIPILNYLDYNKDDAIEILKAEAGWRPYSRKHGESLFTRFFQEFYLPEKFGIDKRRMHFSSLICAGHMSRDDALDLLETPMYSPQELENDIEFVCKKLQISRHEFYEILKATPKQHKDYAVAFIFKQYDSPLYRWARMLATGRSRHR